MARFDVYANHGNQAASTPYLLDVQSDLLDGLGSKAIIPLRSLKHFPSVKLPTRLTPTLTIQGADYLLETPKMAAVPTRVLGPAVTPLKDEQATVSAALDFLFQGY